MMTKWNTPLFSHLDYVPVQLTANNKNIGIVLDQPMDYRDAWTVPREEKVYGKVWSLFSGRLLDLKIHQ
jgi:hypothetical protein